MCCTNDSDAIESLNSTGKPNSKAHTRTPTAHADRSDLENGNRSFDQRRALEDTQPVSRSNPCGEESGNSKRVIMLSFVFWCVGFGISLFPVLVIPFEKISTKERFSSALNYLGTDLSLMYVGVAMLVTAMNDLRPNQTIRRVLYFLFLFVAVALYSIITILIELEGVAAVNSKLTMVLNIVFFLIPLVLGLQQYYKMFKEKK